MKFSDDDKVFVQSIEKKKLTPAQHDVIALCSFFPERLSKVDSSAQSRRADAVKVLKRLADSDQDWGSVILIAGFAGQGYGLAAL